ncbi:hypothetical protein NSERUTF1_5889 [Nocardia seriolae]|nr:hypothetical protein NSERUTF1_5889 [Nocardia seriolae]
MFHEAHDAHDELAGDGSALRRGGCVGGERASPRGHGGSGCGSGGHGYRHRPGHGCGRAAGDDGTLDRRCARLRGDGLGQGGERRDGLGDRGFPQGDVGGEEDGEQAEGGYDEDAAWARVPAGTAETFGNQAFMPEGDAAAGLGQPGGGWGYWMAWLAGRPVRVGGVVEGLLIPAAGVGPGQAVQRGAFVELRHVAHARSDEIPARSGDLGFSWTCG